MDFIKSEPFTPVKIEWCQSFVLKLIEYWEENKCLYDSKNRFYHNKLARTKALDEIATKMQNLIPDVTPTDIRTKINYLRSQYGRELLKLQIPIKSGASAVDLYQPSPYWFKQLGFLKEFMSVGKGKCNISHALEDTSSELESIPSSSKHKKIEWCQTFVLKLIEYWEENECLYNSKSRLYRNKHARTKALDVIATKMRKLIPDVTPTDIKTKIIYLRTQYGRELSKLQNPTKSGASTDDLYQSSSYWFKQLSFLKDFMSVRKGKCNLSYASEDTSSELESLPSFSKRKKVSEDNSSELESISTFSKRKKASEETSFESESPPSFSKRIKVDEETDNSINDITTTDDVLKKCTDFLEMPFEPSEDDGTANFFRLQLGEITNKDLKDEVTSKIILLLFEYKKKNRDLAA